MQTQPLRPEQHRPLRGRLRLLSAVGIAGVAAGVLVETFSEHLGPRVPAAMAGGQLMTLPVLWVPLATLLATVAWTYLLLGALHAPLALRALVGAGWAILVWPLVTISPLWVAPWALIVLALLTWRGWARPLVDFGPREGMVLGAPAFLTFLGAVVASLREPSLPLLSYNAALSGHFAFFTLVALPLLVLAGNDLAEAATQVGVWATKLTEALRPRTLGVIVGLLGLLQAGYLVIDGLRLQPGFWLTILVVGALFALGRQLPVGEFLAEPPFPLLVGLIALSLAAPIGGTLLVTLLPPALTAALPVAGFLGSALVAALGSLLGRRWLERRWSGSWVALLLGALWIAWLVAGSKATGWGPSHRALLLTVAAGAILLAVRALRRPEESERCLRLSLEALAVLLAISAIQAVFQRDLDPADLFTALQILVVVGTTLWVGLPRRRHWVAMAVVVAGALLIWALPLFGAWAPVLQLVLMALGLIWGIVAAHRRMGELLGEGRVQVHLTFLLIGFSLMGVAVLGWNRSLVPAPEALTDFGYLAQFGLVAVGMPLYLFSVVQRFYHNRGVDADGHH